MTPNTPSKRTFFIGLALPLIFAQQETCNGFQCHFPEEDGAISYIQTHAASVEKAKVPAGPQHAGSGKSERHEGRLVTEHADDKNAWLYEEHTVSRPGKNTQLMHHFLALIDEGDPSGHAAQHTAEKALYFTSLFVSGAVTTIIFWPLGAGCILKILAYLLTGCTVTLTVKMVYSESFHFQYAKLLTVFHLLTSAVLGFGILLYRRYVQEKPLQVPTVSEFGWKLMPLCLGFSYSLGCSNMALMYCSVAFAAIIGASTPFFSVLLLILLGMPFNLYLLLPISGIVFGCMATVAGTLEFSMYGLMLVLLGNLGRSVKAVLQQWIMTGEVKEKYDPVTLLSWQCLICAPMMLAWSLATEGTEAFAALFNQTQPALFLSALALSCANAAVMNALHIFVIKDLGAVGIQATAQLKQGLTALGGVVMFGDKFTSLNVIGGSVVLASAFWYARADSHLKSLKSKAAASEALAGSPTQSPGQEQTSNQGQVKA